MPLSKLLEYSVQLQNLTYVKFPTKKCLSNVLEIMSVERTSYHQHRLQPQQH